METKPLKSAPLWWLVVINYISSFFLAGLLISVLGLGVYITAPNLLPDAESTAFMVMMGIGYLLALWLMTFNAARFLKTRYVIPDSKKVVMYTAALALVLSLFGYLSEYVSYGWLPDVYAVGFLAVELAVFYVLSSKYLRAS